MKDRIDSQWELLPYNEFYWWLQNLNNLQIKAIYYEAEVKDPFNPQATRDKLEAFYGERIGLVISTVLMVQFQKVYNSERGNAIRSIQAPKEKETEISHLW